MCSLRNILLYELAWNKCRFSWDELVKNIICFLLDFIFCSFNIPLKWLVSISMCVITPGCPSLKIAHSQPGTCRMPWSSAWKTKCKGPWSIQIIFNKFEAISVTAEQTIEGQTLGFLPLILLVCPVSGQFPNHQT